MEGQDPSVYFNMEKQALVVTSLNQYMCLADQIDVSVRNQINVSNIFFFLANGVQKVNQLQHPRYINKNKHQQKEKGDVHQNLLNKKEQKRWGLKSNP
jgi:hypothetical protein